MANNSVVTQEVLQNTLERYHEDFVYPYQNGATHTGFTPVGTVISYFGETAPEYFLVCDGTEYAKSDYPQLADLLLNLTDPTPFEGSDANHFKVPDLRGEFLRGTGTNGHTNQGSGANVGVHQDATLFPGIQTYNYSTTETTITAQLHSNRAGESNGITNADSSVINPWYYADSAKMTIKNATGTTASKRTSRPTNTSVLYCIAYKDIYIDLALDSFPLSISNPTDGQALVWNGTEGRWKNAGILHEYSTDEKVVGTWIDGKTLYEKVYHAYNPSGIYILNTDGKGAYLQYVLDEHNLGDIIYMNGRVIQSNGQSMIVPSMNMDEQSGVLYIQRTLMTQVNTNYPTLFVKVWKGSSSITDLGYDIVVQYTKTTD